MANYQVLYNKYRPKTFDDVIGQDNIIKTLKNEIALNTIAHSYLFIGSRGTGKTTCARIFAKAINCENPVDGEPCNECNSCKSISDNTNLDILEIDAASNNGIDDMRELKENLSYTPTSSKYRVVIIDEVHMLSNSAFNSLLKIIEEPPAHVIFLLATTDVEKVPATIISRCQRFDFKRIGTNVIADRIDWVVKNEGKTIDRSASMLIARKADGGMRDALSLLENIIHLDDHLTEDRVRAVLGLPDVQYLIDISDAISYGELATIMRIINTLNANSRSMTGICDQLITYYRDMLLVKMRGEDGLPDYIVSSAKKYTTKRIVEIIDALNECYQKMLNGNSRCMLEVGLIQLADMSKTEFAKETNPIIAALETRVKELENAIKRIYGTQAEKILVQTNETSFNHNAITIEQHASQTSSNNDAVKPEPIKEQIPEFKNLKDKICYYSDHANKFDEWSKIVKTITRKYKDIGSALANVDAYEYDGYVLISFDDIIKKYLKDESNKIMIKKAIEYVTQKTYEIAPYLPTVTN